MKRIFVLFCLLTSVAHAEMYKVNVKKIDSNLYMTDNKIIIETQFCYELANFWEEAILKYDKYSYDNKLIFVGRGTTCDVKSIR